MSGAAVFTIAPERPFLKDLVAGLYADPRFALVGDPAALARVRIFLPTRRACRALAEAFVEANGGRPVLLPRITPLGDIDDDEFDPAPNGGEDGYDPAALADLPPAISPLRRQLLLARLVVASRSGRIAPDQALRLAGELARLLDQVHTEGLDFADLARLVPEDFARHWQITLEFLAIITRHWPEILAAEGAIDPADRRSRLLRAQAQAWRARPPDTPVIAAGSTGSVPATAELLAVIACCPLGAVVLPGLDMKADAATYAALAREPSHPQYGMSQLLERIGVNREDVQAWPEPTAAPTPTVRLRAPLINLALRPAETAHAPAKWPPLKQALEDCVRILAPTAQEEARAIALILREALYLQRRGMLVTPDRALARRVAAELGRWDIAVDDSAGVPLANTQPGTFLRLSARMLADRLAPVSLLAVLKHPLAAGGLSPPVFRRRVRRLERAVLRGPRPAPGLGGLAAALARAAGGSGSAGPEDATAAEHRQAVVDLIERLSLILAPVEDLFAGDDQPLAGLLKRHLALAEAFAETDCESGGTRLWAGDAGEAAFAFAAEVLEAADDAPPLSPSAYPALLDALMAGRTVRPRFGRDPRLAILGPLEARLIAADVVVLAGLNEGNWPATAQASPWMSRPMMKAFGLPLPERRIGLSAHDFVQGFCAPRVFLTRAARVEGAPTVPSRWLVRLENVVRDTEMDHWLANASRHLGWQDLLDPGTAPSPVARPQPRPAVAARPRRLSVTQIEAWMRNPYSIYARHILRLKPLKPIDEDPSAADYGQFIHRALDVFVRTVPSGPLPADALARLLDIGRAELAQTEDRPSVRAFWWPKLERIARWFIAAEADGRRDILTVATEVQGEMTIAAAAGPFVLSGRADRIDRQAGDGRLVIIDYKTGSPPTEKEIKAGFAPQLPLEAAMVQAGGFPAVPAAPVAALEFWRLHGKVDGGERCRRVKDADVAQVCEDAIAGLQALVARFDLAETPYLARPRASVAPKFDDYEHLARVLEWSAGAEADQS